MRFSVYFNDEFASKVDAEAKRLGITRSSYISIACSEKIENDAARAKIGNMAEAFQKESIRLLQEAAAGKEITQEETERRLREAVQGKKKNVKR